MCWMSFRMRALPGEEPPLSCYQDGPRAPLRAVRFVGCDILELGARIPPSLVPIRPEIEAHLADFRGSSLPSLASRESLVKRISRPALLLPNTRQQHFRRGKGENKGPSELTRVRVPLLGHLDSVSPRLACRCWSAIPDWVCPTHAEHVATDMHSPAAGILGRCCHKAIQH